MKGIKEPIYFFLPYLFCDPNDFLTLDNFWDLIVTINKSENLHHKQHIAIGNFVWILQTFLYLKSNGFPCFLVHKVPSEGIVIAHTRDLKTKILPTESRMIISIQSDKKAVYPYAFFHIVQNKKDPLYSFPYNLYFSPVYIRHWPQPKLLPRNPHRAVKFENIYYMGIRGPYDTAIKKLIEGMNLHCNMVYNFQQWNDYSEADCIVAIRGFGENYSRKPATKLFNCWLAGVPAILGRESAYRSERKNALDYLEAASMTKLALHLRQLRDNPALRIAMIEQAEKRAEEVTPQAITQDWVDFLIKQAIPAFKLWKSSPSMREALWNKRRLFS